MSAGTPYLHGDAIGVIPTLMLVLVMLLTTLGVIAHAAFV